MGTSLSLSTRTYNFILTLNIIITMADTGRQSMTDKAAASMKPESQKSMTEQASDKVKGMSDSVASTLQPQSEKSTTQKAGDTMSGNSNEGQESLMEKAKHTMGMGGAEK